MKRKLNFKGRIVVTLLLIIVAVTLYNYTPELGKMAQNSSFYQYICIIVWTYLFMIQFIILNKIWEV